MREDFFIAVLFVVSRFICFGHIMYQMTLSVCLIVKNETEVIGRCLNCASKFADEIIVVDTGSVDGTVAEVKKYTDKVFFFEWSDDFSAARNFAFDKASCELLMWLDADDYITDENCEKISLLKSGFKNYDMAFLKYAAAFDGDTPTYVYPRERIFRRDCGYRFSGAVHEAVAPRGRILYSDAVIYHKKVKESDPMRNLNIFQKLIRSGAALDGRQKFYYGRELLFNNMYREGIAVLEDFLNGEGWIVNKAEACYNLYTAYNALGDGERATLSLLRALASGKPDCRLCCLLGGRFMQVEDYSAAEFWYKTALALTDDENSGGFIDRDYGGFVPYMQLCVVYDRLGDIQRAYECNEAAGRIKPLNANYLSNVKYFEKLGFRGKIND